MNEKLLDALLSYLQQKIDQASSARRFYFTGLSYELASALLEFIGNGHDVKIDGQKTKVLVLDLGHRGLDSDSYLDEAGSVNLRNEAGSKFVLIAPYGSSCSMSIDTTVEVIGIEDESYQSVEQLVASDLYVYLLKCFIASGTSEGRYIRDLLELALQEIVEVESNQSNTAELVWQFLSGVAERASVERIDVKPIEAYGGFLCSTGMQIKQQKFFFENILPEIISDSSVFLEVIAGLKALADDGRADYTVDDVTEFEKFVSLHMPDLGGRPHATLREAYCETGVYLSWWERITVEVINKIFRDNDSKKTFTVEALNPLWGRMAGRRLPVLFDEDIAFAIESRSENDDQIEIRKGRTTGAPIDELDLPASSDVEYKHVLTSEEKAKKKGEFKLFFKAQRMRAQHSCHTLTLPYLQAGMFVTIKDIENVAKIKPFKIKNKQASRTFRSEITVDAPGDAIGLLFVNDISRVNIVPVAFPGENGETLSFNFQKEEDARVLKYSFRLNLFNELTFRFKGYVDGEEYTYEVAFFVNQEKTIVQSSDTYYDEHVRRNLLGRLRPLNGSEKFEVDLPAGRDIYELERVLMEEATKGNGGYPIIFADDYRDVLNGSERPDFSQPVSYTSLPFGSGLDSRPDFEAWHRSATTYGAPYFEIRQKLFSLFATRYPEQRMEEIDLALLDDDLLDLVKEYAQAYENWLKQDYVNAAVSETIWVYAIRDNGSLSELPSQILVPPIHPLRFAWQVWAQKMMGDAERECPSPAVSIFDTDAIPDMICLPVAAIGTRNGSVGFASYFSVLSTSRYWGVLHNFELLPTGLRDNVHVWGDNFGVAFAKSSKTITKDQVESALNDAREMCLAKPMLSISFNGESGKGVCREGILAWNYQFIEENNEEVSQLGPRRLKIYDVGGKHLPSKEDIGKIGDESSGAIQWYAPDTLNSQMDLSIATLSAHDCSVKDSDLGDSVTVAGGLACYRTRQLCNGSYVIESRRTTAAKDWRPTVNPLQDVVAQILQSLARAEGVSIPSGKNHIGFPTDVKALVSNERSSYYAISSADVDHACFVACGNSDAYLWDYRLPQNNLGTRNTEGFYLLARETPVMFKAVARAISSICHDNTVIPDGVIKNTLHITAQRGIPTIKDLTLGGTKALGEVGILVAVSMLQGDITNGITQGVFPAYKEENGISWFDFVVPFDPFRRQFEALLSSNDKKVRPDLACISICAKKEGDGYNVLRSRFSFIEVKTRTSRFSDTEKLSALQQYETCYRVLKEAITSDKFTLKSLAAYDFLVGLFTFGFRVYATFRGSAELNLSSFYTNVVEHIFSSRDFVYLDPVPRLLIVDSGETLASDRMADVHSVVRINGQEACTALARQRQLELPTGVIAHWGLLADVPEGAAVVVQPVQAAPATDANDLRSSRSSVEHDTDHVAQEETTATVSSDPHIETTNAASQTTQQSGETVRRVMDEDLANEVDTVKQQLLKALVDSNIRGTLVGQPVVAANSIIFTFDGSVPSMSVPAIQNKILDFKVHYGVEILRVVPQRLKVAVHVKREKREMIQWKNAWPRFSSECISTKKLFIGIGEANGAGLFLDPGKHGPHSLIAGTTGSGKSVLLRDLLLGIGLVYTPQQARIVLIDPKHGQDYFAFDGMPHFHMSRSGEPWIGEQSEAQEILKSLVKEMNERVKKMSKLHCGDLAEYQRKIGDPSSPDWIPRLWVFHDEFAVWMLDKDYKKLVDSTIAQLAVMARSAGIHLMFATQRPSNDVVSVQTRNNLSNRLILKVADEGTSKIALGCLGAEGLQGKGHILLRLDGEDSQTPIEGQVAFMTSSEAEDAVKKIIERYRGVPLGKAFISESTRG